jgi:hypothetical protein
MHERSSVYEPVSIETQSFHLQFNGLKFLAFSGWTLLSLCLWAGIVETVRLMLF